MRLSDAMKQQREDLFVRLQKLSKTADTSGVNGGPRLFDATEEAEWDRLSREIDELDKQLQRQVNREQLQRDERPDAQRGVPVLTNERGEPLTVLRSTDKLVDRQRGASRELLAEFSIGAVLKGIATGRWDGRVGLQRALGETTLPGGGYTVPQALSAAWLDALRAQSIMITSGTLTLPMDTMTLRVAGIATAPEPTSRKENTAIATSEPTFRAVDFKAKSYGVLITSALELLQDSPNAEAMIQASMLGAMTQALDGACLNGDGVTTGNLDNVLGLLQHPGVVAVPVTAPVGDYDAFIIALGAIGAENITADTAAMSPTTAATLELLKTGLSGDKTTLVPPPSYAALAKPQSSAMPAATAALGDFARGAIGLRQSIEIEATRYAEGFKNAQVEIRALMRFDYQPLWGGKGFRKITGLSPTE